MPLVIAFDVNETLLDTSSLDAPFARLFGDAAVRRDWFRQLLLFSQAATLAGPYHDFSAIVAPDLAAAADAIVAADSPR